VFEFERGGVEVEGKVKVNSEIVGRLESGKVE
jgi:hypothetical protein